MKRKGILRVTKEGVSYSDMTPELFSKLKEEKKESFGFLGSDADKTGYDPTIKNVEDVLPKDTQFYKQRFRLLSATIVGSNSYKATDFSNVEILRNSAPMLEGKPLFIDHNIDSIYNIAGVVKGVSYANGYTDNEGNKVPSGIEADVWIDATTHGEIVRRVSQKTVNSGSVTVVFDWTPSHDFKGDNSYYDFDEAVGQEVDGEMVRRIVTGIDAYWEYSLVLEGADPFAKQVDATGKINKPAFDRSFSFSNEGKDKFNTNKNKKKMENEKLFLKFLEKFGLKKEEFTEEWITSFSMPEDNPEAAELLKLSEAIKGKFENEILLSEALPQIKVSLKSDLEKTEKELSTLKETEISLKSELEDSKVKVEANAKEVVELSSAKVKSDAEIVELKATISGNVQKVKHGEAFIAEKRAETIRLYNVTVNNKPNPAMLKMIEDSSDEQLNAWIESYGGSIVASYGATCKDCNSKNISMQSSFRVEDVEAEEERVEYLDNTDSIRERKQLENTKINW